MFADILSKNNTLSEKVVAVSGDIAKPKFGIDPPEWTELAKKVPAQS